MSRWRAGNGQPPAAIRLDIRALADDEFDRGFADGRRGLVEGGHPITEPGIQQFDLDDLRLRSQPRQEFGQVNGCRTPASGLEYGERPFVIGVARRDHALLVQILVRNGNDQMAAGFDDAQPVGQSLHGIDQMFQAMAGMNEIERSVGNPRHELSIAVGHVPGYDIVDTRKQFDVKGEGIGSGADIDSGSDEISRGETVVMDPSHHRLTCFLHPTAPVQNPPTIPYQ